MKDILENLGIVLLIVISVAAQIAKAVKKNVQSQNCAVRRDGGIRI